MIPPNFSGNVSPSAAVVFTFNEEMDTALTVAEFLDSTTFMTLPVSSAWSSGNKVLTCTPTPAFPSNRNIFWTMDGESLVGDPLEGAGGFFTTGSGGTSTGSGTNRITSFTVGKIHNYNQSSAGSPTLDPDVPYGFIAITALASNRTANSVDLTLPTGATSNLMQNFVQPESYFLFAAWTNLALFNANFPAGNYVFDVQATSSNQLVIVNLPANFVQPNAPHTTSFAAAQAVDVTQPFQISWDAFQGGTAADYIYVYVGNAFESPDPGMPGALAGTATSISIPAGTLQAGTPYEASIGFYRATTTSNANLTTSAYLATTTDFTLITSSGGSTHPLVLTNSTWSGNTFSFDITSSPGQAFTVEYSLTMLTNQWQTLLTTNSATGRVQITDATPNQYRFYRARKLP